MVASAGNDGLGGNVKPTYPASYPGVLAVAASDRNNERAAFSQSGAFVGVAAPGVDMVSTVPGGGHCADNGTSFSAPYVAGVAALIKAKHPRWTQREIVAQIQQTAERSMPAMTAWSAGEWWTRSARSPRTTTPREAGGTRRRHPAHAPTPAALHLGETDEERTQHLAMYVATGAAVAGGGPERGRGGGPGREDAGAGGWRGGTE